MFSMCVAMIVSEYSDLIFRSETDCWALGLLTATRVATDNKNNESNVSLFN